MSLWLVVPVIAVTAFFVLRFLGRIVTAALKLLLVAALVLVLLQLTNEGVAGLNRLRPEPESIEQLLHYSKQAGSLLSEYEIHVEIRKRSDSAEPKPELDPQVIMQARRY